MGSAARLAVVTGASAGLGRAVAEVLLARGWAVLGVARRPASVVHGSYRHRAVDLGDPGAVEAFAGGLSADAAIAGAARLGLVNAAGMLGVMRPLTRLRAVDLEHVLRVNAVAPLLLSGAMARLAGDRPLRIVDVSSGAARASRAGRTGYSASKAALRLGGMALAADAAAGIGATPRDLAVISYEPGMVDTAMQAENRAASPDDFPDAVAFARLHAAGGLVPPGRPAAEIADLLDRDDLPAWSERALGAG
jgi:NAD(P)-dependent dehydrogenase (short-subunit alcohol dehydrogenase family)